MTQISLKLPFDQRMLTSDQGQLGVVQRRK